MFEECGNTKYSWIKRRFEGRCLETRLFDRKGGIQVILMILASYKGVLFHS
jgi:hypothetical protein